ncbi:MAG: RluA family pseudouridine synthase [Elusimicrobiota bacterium]
MNGHHTVEQEHLNKRVDVYLAEKYPECSRGFFQRQIKTGNVLVNDKRIDPAFRLTTGAVVTITLPEKLPDAPIYPGRRLDPGLLDVIYEDDCIIIINKPAGMSVHPPGYASGMGTGIVPDEGYRRPGMPTLVEILGQGYYLVHRLDKDTSGVIIAAKTPQAQFALSKQFKNREVRKTYLGIVCGRIEEKKGIIKSHLSRSPVGGRKIKVGFGRESITEFEVLKRMDALTLVKIHPVTGRTHQIRVHFASIKHPIAGDKLYGQGAQGEGRHLLHAWKIQFVHPGSRRIREWTAVLPPDFLAVCSLAGYPLSLRTE